AGEFKTAALLLGDRATRCLVTLPEPGPLQGRILAGQYRLTLPGPRCTLVLGFRKELAEARELLRNARAAAADGRPAAAFELVRDLVRRLPHDAEMLAQAQALRSELQAKAAEAVHGISTDLDDAEFFNTRGGFERAVRDLDKVRDLYGGENLPDRESVA